jgi:hypothetical protein
MNRVRFSPWKVAIGLFLLFVFLNPGRNESTDARVRLAVAREMWTHGRISLAEGDEPLPRYWTRRSDGRVVSYYHPGQSLVFVPFDALGCLLAGASPGPLRTSSPAAWWPIAVLLEPALGALWWWLLWRILTEWGFTARFGAAAAAMCLVGTIALFYIGFEQEEALVGVALAAALLCTLRWESTGRAAFAAGAGAALGFAVLTRPDALFGLLGIAPVFLSARRGGRWRAVLAAVAASAPFAAVFLLYDKVRYGSIWSLRRSRDFFHFALGGTVWGIDTGAAFRAVGLLIGPGKGWFVLSPFLLTGLAGFAVMWRRSRALTLGCLSAFLAAAVFDSGFADLSDGAWSWGTRYLVFLVTFWAIPAACGVERLLRTRRFGLLAVPCLASLAIQAGSVFFTQNLEYIQLREESIWNSQPLVTGVRHGQLFLRARNIVQWIGGRRGSFVEAPMAPEDLEVLPLHVREEMNLGTLAPNFWGPVTARRLPAPAGRAVLAVWAATGLGTALLLYFGFFPRRDRGEDP